MPLSLAKGQWVYLEKVAPGLVEIFVGLGWDIKATDEGYDFDLDASVFLLGNNEKLISDQHFIFYNNLTSPDANKSVQHMGDNLTDAGAGDDEVIKINLQKVPPEAQKIVVTVTIHEADKQSQNFAQRDPAVKAMRGEGDFKIKQITLGRKALNREKSPFHPWSGFPQQRGSIS